MKLHFSFLILTIVLLSLHQVDTVFAENDIELRQVRLFDMDWNVLKSGYDFSSGILQHPAGGDIYYKENKLYSDLPLGGQRGIMDLSLQQPPAQFDPTTIDIPDRGFLEYVEAQPQHIYLTPAAREENRYILFWIRNHASSFLDLDYYILDTGTIIVNTNQIGGFRIQGPRSFIADGPRWDKEHVLTGTYAIEFDPIPGFETPRSQTKTLYRGSEIKFEALYTPIFDYSVTISPSTQTIELGGTATYTVNVAVVSGTGETVDLSISGLPGDVPNSLSTASGTAPYSSTLTVDAATATSTGTFTITVTATGAGKSKTATATLTITIKEKPSNSIPPEIIIALIGASATIISAYFGYLAIAKKRREKE